MIVLKALLAVVISIILLLSRASCKRPFLYFLEANTSFLPEYMSQYEIKIVPKSPSTTLDIKMVFDRNSTSDPMMEIHVMMKQSEKFEYRRILQFDFDICKILTRENNRGIAMERSAAKVVELWMSNLKKFGTLPSCPILAGEYVLRNLKATTNIVPSFVVSGIYRVDVFYYLTVSQPRHYTANSSILIKVKWK